MGAPKQLPEHERNELLRRVDWRFLLRQDREPSSVCFASGRLARALELISTRSSHGEADRAAVDLAVLVNPKRRSLSAARAALRPGGELYVEQHIPLPGGRARLRRRLDEAGFTDVRCYWPWPWPDRASPQFWLPLDAPEAINFFLRSRPEGLRRSRRRVLLRILWRSAARLGLLVPICAVARSPDAERDGREVEEIVRGRWQSWGFGRAPERLSWVLLTGGLRSINKVVGLIFADSEQVPRLAVKFARSRSEEGPLWREAATLHMLEDTRAELRGLPKVLFMERRSGRLALGETAVSGRPLLVRLSRETYAELATLVTSWVADLAGAAELQQRALWWPRLVEEPLREFERTFGRVTRAGDLVRARSALSELGNLPLVCEHRDCSPWNILLTDGNRLALLDWESSEPRGLPALDLVYFLTYAAFFVEGALQSGQTREAYARTLDSGTFTGRIVRSCEESYCERVGLDPALLRPLRLLCWVVHSRSDYKDLELDAAAPPDQDALRGSLFLALWQEELRRIEAHRTS